MASRPSKRERDAARRRYAEQQRRAEEQAARRRHRRTVGLVVVGALAALVLVGAVVFTGLSGGPDATSAAPTSVASPQTTATPTAVPTAAPTGTPTAGATTPAANPCPTPTTTPAAQAPELDGPPAASTAQDATAVIATSCGDITVQLDATAAPQAVASFEYLAQQGFFDATPCHRLTTEGIFVLQCGDPTGTGTGGPGYSFGPVENAPEDGVYPAGTLAMARQAGDASSNGSQFFLVYEDSTIPADAAGGYTVFGQVTSGLDVVQQVAAGGTAADGTAPARAISIEGVSIQ